MLRDISRILVALVGISMASVSAEESSPKPVMSTTELANWIDERFAETWRKSQITAPQIVDDATFLRRVYLDLSGTVPPVSEAREFLAYEGGHKREFLVEKLLSDTRRPQKHAERTAAHWATLWRRMMVPGNSPEAQSAVMLEPWLKDQFASNVPYDEMVRLLVTAKSDGQAMMTATPAGTRSAAPAMYFQVVGGKPESAANAVTRMFLGVRIGCAECHDHPFAEWKQKDFWGMAAFFSGVKNGAIDDAAAARIRPENSAVEYAAAFLGSQDPVKTNGKSPRQTLVDWITSPDNPDFAATAVNRVWLHLIGRGMTDSVDDLDKPSDGERAILDELAKLFVNAKYDLRWLIGGICKSQLYQRQCIDLENDQTPPPGLRIVKTLTPEQIFNSLEQALALPVARADGSARFNGLRDQLISRMNEAASNRPDEFRAGIPQALLLMNGRLTTEATDLDRSRTLRGVLDAPFLNTEDKLTTLFLAALSRTPRPDEQKFMLDHVSKQDQDKRNQAFAEIFWAILNSPEFVLEK